MIVSSFVRTAVVLFNLGGPDKPESVKPFLFNLFNDPAIIRAPKLVRYALAKFISSRRAPVAQEIYKEMGGGSPIVENTRAQARALKAQLEAHGEAEVFICMRYWHPMSAQVAQQVKAYRPDQVILLPLYPQFSTTTTQSSYDDWTRAAKAANLDVPTRLVCCYPTDTDFISAHAALLRRALEGQDLASTRILFSAHGLPEKIVKDGDPYQWQVEQTTHAVVEALGVPQLDYINCYQSRVGPLKWIGPATDDEIRRAGAEGKSIILVPIAFVSEHSETLVELDIEYKHLADEAGVKTYIRVPTLSVQPGYARALAAACLQSTQTGAICSSTGSRLCPKSFRRCPMPC